tara:strand:- start:1850 stop:2143 length:294 start_codon:yes stop_codon:yes gene_type:complete
MIGQNKYLLDFKDKYGETPELGDMVLAPSWSRIETVYVLGVYLKNANSENDWPTPYLLLRESLEGDIKYSHEVSKGVFKNCIIIKKNKLPIVWQVNK